jgi:hypothetical protein
MRKSIKKREAEMKKCIRCHKEILQGHSKYCIDCAIEVNREKYKLGLEKRKEKRKKGQTKS